MCDFNFLSSLSLSFALFLLVRAHHSVGGSMQMESIEKLLAIPTQDIPHLTILLQAACAHTDVEIPYVHWFLRHSRCPVTVLTYVEAHLTLADNGKVRRMAKNRDSFAIVTNESSLLATANHYIQRAGSFFFVLSGQVDNERLRGILSTLWNRYQVFRIYILTRQEGILIYNPFDFDTQLKAYGKIMEYTGERTLDRILFSDMGGYPLRVQIFKSVYARPTLDAETRKIHHVTGVDGEVANLLQHLMNFTMNLQDPDPHYFGEKTKNGSYNGVIGSIISNEIDMCMTGFFVKDYMVPEMVFSVAVYDDQLCIYVPKAKSVPQSILPILSVSYDVWLGFILAAFACATIWWIMRRLNLWLGISILKDSRLEDTLRLQFIRIYIDTWVVWVRVNILHYPPYNSERIFIASLCLVSVIFGAIFESSLATVYIKPMYYKDINTLQELDDSGFSIIYKYSSMADDLFFSDTSPLFASLNKKLTHLSNLNADVIWDISRNGGKASVTRYSSLMLESLHYLISKTIWIVPECPKYYTISYVMPKDSPWEDTVNYLLLQFLSAGLVKKWINDMKTQIDIKIMKEQRIAASDTFKVLTVVDLQLAFYVVIIGNVLAGLSYIAEHYVKSEIHGSSRGNNIHPLVK